MPFAVLTQRTRPLSGFATLLALSTLPAQHVDAGTVDFSGINLAQVATAAGQNFPYIIGASGPSGTLNARLLFGPVDSMTIGSSPDVTGFYALQQTPASIGIPFQMLFSFSSNVDFTIIENETLTSFEENTFNVSTGNLSLVSSADAIVTSLGNTHTVQGATPGGGAPYGTYVLQGQSTAFDMFVRNVPGQFTVYGSSISIDVIPEPSSLGALLLAGAGVLARRRTR